MFWNKSFLFYGLLALAGFLAGYDVASDKYQLELKEQENKFLKTALDSQTKSNDTARAINTSVQEIESRANNEIKDITDRYKRLSDGLHISDGNTGSMQVPEPAGAISRANAPCNCRQSKEYTGLKRQYVELAYKCDMQAERYNRLVKIYLTTQKEIEKFNQ